MPNITVTHADSGVVQTRVARTERVTPHMHQVTFAGGDLDNFVHKGFDQWFRLAIPVHDGDRLDKVPSKFTFGTLIKFMAMPRGTRPTIRNYTVRDFRPAADGQPAEMDVDFVIHGDSGVAGPWAVSAEPGAPVALVDQGCGWKPVPAAQSLIVTDESGMAAALGVLRDMPRDATGHAIIEIFDDKDRQDDDAPEGVTVHWLVRKTSDDPGTLALPALRELGISADLYAFTVGESALIKGVRRHLVNDRGVPKANVTFSGYWRIGKSAPS
jgi:NADPH-dependent ferric siderophore reductase